MRESKKYKKCCELKRSFVTPPKEVSQKIVNEFPAAWMDDEDHLCRDSNRVVDLIHEGLLDEAEEGAKQLLVDYPEVHDGFDRLAMIYEKRGDYAQAIEMYQKALDFTIGEDNCYDEEIRYFFRGKITMLTMKTIK